MLRVKLAGKPPTAVPGSRHARRAALFVPRGWLPCALQQAGAEAGTGSLASAGDPPAPGADRPRSAGCSRPSRDAPGPSAGREACARRGRHRGDNRDGVGGGCLQAFPFLRWSFPGRQAVTVRKRSLSRSCSFRGLCKGPGCSAFPASGGGTRLRLPSPGLWALGCGRRPLPGFPVQPARLELSSQGPEAESPSLPPSGPLQGGQLFRSVSVLISGC